MKKYSFQTVHRKLLADTFTPVGMYLQLRDKFPNSLLLESSDYHGNENSFSYICCDPVAAFRVEGETLFEKFPDGTENKTAITEGTDVVDALGKFAASFVSDSGPKGIINNGLFGYMCYDAVRYYEDIRLENKVAEGKQIPDLYYKVFRYVIAVDHFHNEVHIFEHLYQQEESRIEQVVSLIRNKNFATYRFQTTEAEVSNFTDEAFMQVVAKGKEHCRRGDVFQIVLSREFSRGFKGDEFNVYRTLRSVNPSPYLFYFDFGNFKIFGSSPEAQIVVKGGVASIYPIAGTFRRTGDDKADQEAALALMEDPKENAEHVMLVDLARNDLSRNCDEVEVETFKEIQYYSHVIHMVSKVSGKLRKNTSPLRVVAETFPAGTLSGAPKHMAMQLIDRYENGGRSFYGGCLGYLGFNGDFNHAIMIRSFLSKSNRLYYQAGAGVVEKSLEENEKNEVNNKLAALNNALAKAEEL
ncbi:MAG: anthranilate synthase component I family protein [Flavobacteriales bacterium]|nr:anthranilate synthase component I family protein [Flavobacteriales bacterium]MCB9449052.1 anthranilate synthase component I family protein [Flavobacteriales bacterium]